MALQWATLAGRVFMKKKLQVESPPHHCTIFIFIKKKKSFLQNSEL